MGIDKKIYAIQKQLQALGLDGWLLYDHHGSNRIARDVLDIPSDVFLTRRFFYWIPAKTLPVVLVHRIESSNLDFLPGGKKLYLSWTELENALKEMLEGSRHIAMEYSPRNVNPNVSSVDAGTMDVVKDLGLTVVSSQDLVQQFTSVLDEEKIQLHKEAAAVLMHTCQKAFELIAERLRADKPVTEFDVQQFMESEFLAQGCIAEEGPICAVNANSALPHYRASRHASAVIQKGDLILLDLWCKKDLPHAIYADITRVAVAAAEPTPRQQEIFDIVKEAQCSAYNLICERMKGNGLLKGYEVDDAARGYITAKGYGEYFTHRTGHNIDTNVHGAGAHLDNLETSDERVVLPGTCFSLEPGIYLPEEFGIRLEYDVLIHPDRQVEITGGKEESIHCLL